MGMVPIFDREWCAYPKGKIYVGQDVTDSINYFGSASSAMIAKDFTRQQRQLHSDAGNSVGIGDGNEMERRAIIQHRSNDPAIGYNRWPRFIGLIPVDLRKA